MEMNADTSSVRLSPEERERIVSGFQAWLDRYLDRALADEEPPQGLTSELLSALENGDPLPPLEGAQPGNGGCDLYSLWAAMTALAQEVRLQGRTFKQLNETLIENARSLETSAAAAVSPVAETAAAEPSRIRQAEARQARKQEIDALLDLRDRIERGSNTAGSAVRELAPSRLPRLARWLGLGANYARHAQEILAAISHGYSLTLDSLDEALVACHVSRIACKGKIFDPQRMTVVDVEEIGSLPEGTVVEVYRNGYEWNGEVYRSAQVKVARPANKI
jgi:hypothetical protein